MEAYPAYVALLLVPGVGPVECLSLSPSEHTLGQLRSAAGRRALSKRLGRPIGVVPWPRFAEQMEAIRRGDVRVLAYPDPDYPDHLRHIVRPPPLLFCRGSARLLVQRGVAIVGTRSASKRACAFARRLAGDLGQLGVMTVSGAARGVDTAVHTGALDANGPTVAVVGTGVDIAYPPENRVLLERITRGGCVVSEQLMGTPALRHVFPSRNRLISGLAHAVVVVEAAERSGALITARWALEQGRDVGAVPSFPGEPRGRGCNALLKAGAFLVEKAEDVLEAVPLLAAEKRIIPGAGPGSALVGVSEHARAVLEILGTNPTDADALSGELGVPVAVVHGALLELEIAGVVARDDTSAYYRK